MANVVAFDTRPKQLSESEALDWLRAQPGGRAQVSNAALAERWGWTRYRVTRRLKEWQAAGLITKRGKAWVVTAKDEAPVAVAKPLIVHEPPLMHELPAVVPAPVPIDPPPVVAAVVSPAVPSVAPTVEPAGSRTTALIVGAAALCLAAVGLILNANFAASLGQTGLAAALLAAIGLAIDMLAVALPTAASKLWQGRHRPAAFAAWLLWAGALIMMLLAGIGFASMNIGDTVAGRAKMANENVALSVRLERLRVERAAIGEHRSVTALEAELQRVQPSAQSVWKATNGCRDVTVARSGQACEAVLRVREAIGTAQHRDVIDAEMRDVERQLASLPAIRLDDPQARTTSDLVAWLSGGLVAPSVHDIHRLRIVGLTVAPACAGLLLWMAVSLWRRREKGDGVMLRQRA
jgi:MarR family